MPAKRGERKEPNAKKTLLISLLIGNSLGVAIFFILLSIASAVILKKGVSSEAYTPVSIICGAYGRIHIRVPDKKERAFVGTLLVRSACCLRCYIRRGSGRRCEYKNCDCGGGCGRVRLCGRYTFGKHEKENALTVPQGAVLSCKI